MLTVVCAAALPEELEAINRYCAARYSVHMPTHDIIKDNILQKFRPDNVNKFIFIPQGPPGFFTISPSSTIVTGAIAYQMNENCLIIILCTGYGTYVSAQTIETIYKFCKPDYWLFSGTSLGISKKLRLGDSVPIKKSYFYGQASLSHRYIHQVKHDIDILPNNSGIALSANLFVDVIKRKSNIAKINSSLELIPAPAQTIAQIIQDQSSQTNKKMSVVLDMETSAVMETLAQYPENQFLIMRVVMDTINDIQRLNAREEMKNISITIGKWMLSKIELFLESQT